MINGMLKHQLEEYFLIDFSVWSELFSILIDSYEMCVCGGGEHWWAAVLNVTHRTVHTDSLWSH